MHRSDFASMLRVHVFSLHEDKQTVELSSYFPLTPLHAHLNNAIRRSLTAPLLSMYGAPYLPRLNCALQGWG